MNRLPLLGLLLLLALAGFGGTPPVPPVFNGVQGLLVDTRPMTMPPSITSWVVPPPQAVAAALVHVTPGSVTVACATEVCLRAMNSIASALTAKGWNVTTVQHGGLGIDGVQGLRVESCLDRAKQIVGALTPLLGGARVDVESDGPCKPGPLASTVVVVGATP